MIGNKLPNGTSWAPQASTQASKERQGANQPKDPGTKSTWTGPQDSQSSPTPHAQSGTTGPGKHTEAETQRPKLTRPTAQRQTTGNSTKKNRDKGLKHHQLRLRRHHTPPNLAKTKLRRPTWGSTSQHSQPKHSRGQALVPTETRENNNPAR